MALAASSPPSPHSHSSRHHTIAWVFACLCCLALGSIASLSTAHYMPRLATSLRVFADSQRARISLPQPPLPSTLSAGSRNSTPPRARNSSAPSRYDRGVIISLHNGIVSMGVSLIRELRCLGNTEVIQVYHCLPSELSADAQALLTFNDSSVEIIDVCTEILSRSGLDGDVDDVFHGDKSLAASFQSYWLKPLALYHTRLQEAILLDADALLLRNPADVRAMSGYVRTGTTFFYDRVAPMNKFLMRAVADNDTSGTTLLEHLVATFDYAAFGLSGPAPSPQLLASLAYKRLTAHEMDSSMVVIDKARAGPDVLAVLKHLVTVVRLHSAFSWGDKEAFWLAFELAQRPYFFSPYGLSLVDSVPNQDLQRHRETLCGSMAHFVPTEDRTSSPELLYVNGKALLEPFPLGIDKSLTADKSRMFNAYPTHVTPRYVRHARSPDASFECMDDMGATPLPVDFYARLLRRRTHYFAAETHYVRGLATCEQL